MLQSSCLCGAIKITFEGEPEVQMRCHCLDCRKFSGSLLTNNLLLVSAGMQTHGTPRTYTKTVDTGNAMTSHFCGDCGTTLYRSTSYSDTKVAVMIGAVDSDTIVEESRPRVELFAKYRPTWLGAVEGAVQHEGTWLPPLPEGEGQGEGERA